MSRMISNLNVANAQQTVAQEEIVILNWFFLDKAHPYDGFDIRCIKIPRPLIDSSVDECSSLFAAELLDQCGFAARETSIKFWMPKDLISVDDATQPEWAETIGDRRDSFRKIFLGRSFAHALKERIQNEEIVHLAITAEGQGDSSNKRQRPDDKDPIDRWKSKRLKSAIPSLSDLAGALAQPLTDSEKIPINQAMYNTFFSSIGPDTCGEDTIESLFRIGEPVEKLYRLISVISDPPPMDGTEESWHSFWDDNIRRPLELLIPTGKSIRNGNRHTQTRNLRPDFGFLIQKVCSFRGEEIGPEDSGDPRTELRNKINWIYDSAPYMFGYYCIGSSITLVAFTPPTESRGGKPEIFDLVTLDLRWRRDRIANIRNLINLSTILPRLSELVQYPVNDFEVFEMTNSMVEITTTLIVKTYTSTNAEAQVEHLQRIYAMLVDWHVPHTDALVFTKKNVVHLSPRGSPSRPRFEKELRECLVCVLEALMVAHTVPLYHRDIRWSNVVRTIHDPSKWFIIDWEDAATPPTMAAPSFARSCHSPAIFQDGHGAEVDIWGVGYLIQTCNIADISTELGALGERICRDSQSLSAEDVYKLITTSS